MAPVCQIDITAGLLRVRSPAKYFVLAEGGGRCFAVTECSARILRRQSTLLLSRLACAEKPSTQLPMQQLGVSIHVGIVCEKCRKLYLLSHCDKLHRIVYDTRRAEFRLTCLCTKVTYFQKGMLRPYSVGDYVLDLGYADLGEYREQSSFKS